MGSEVFARRLQELRDEKVSFHCDKCDTTWNTPASLYYPKCGELCSSMTKTMRMKAEGFTAIYGNVEDERK